MSEVKIISALIKIQSEVTNIAKDTQGFGYKYAKLDSVLDMLRPIFNKHGVLIWQDVSSEDGEMVRITTSFIHESGEKKEQVINYRIPALAKMNSMQNLGSAISYLRRYCLMTMVGIAGTEDDDGKTGGDYIDKHKASNSPSHPPKISHQQEPHYYSQPADTASTLPDEHRDTKIAVIHNLLGVAKDDDPIKMFIQKSMEFYKVNDVNGLTDSQVKKIIERIETMV